MTNRLRSFLLAGAASLGLGALAIGPAHALIAIDTSDFVFEETISGGVGTFTIINKPGSGWYIWGFGVVNVVGSNPATSYKDWNPGTCNNNCGGPGFLGSGFAYQTGGPASTLSNDIAPGSSSDLFTYIDAPTGSTPQLYLINVDGNIAYVTPTGTIPELSTWAMLIAGFGFLGWRYALKTGGLRKPIGAA